MFGLDKARAAVESEGVYIGGWSLRQAIWPKKVQGEYGRLCNRTYPTIPTNTERVQLLAKTVSSM